MLIFIATGSQAAVNPSFAQLDALGKLTPEQRQKAMGFLAGGGARQLSNSQLNSRQSLLKKQNKAQKAKFTELDTPMAEEFVLPDVLQAGDSLIVYFELLKAYQTANPKRDTSLKYTPDNSQIMYTLDKTGEIKISGLGDFAVAGLTEKQAAARINLENLLSEYKIKVLALPIQRFGLSKLTPFGYELFNQDENQILPDVSMPAPENYLVGPGDKINIQLIGKENQEYLLEVSRGSTLSFPKIGAISVSGLTFDELKSNLNRRIKRQYLGVDAFITLGELRSIQVFVLGEVNKPGSYSVDGLSTMTNALLNGGGITNIGSLRSVELKRAGKLVGTLDLYDLLLKGDTSRDLRLRPGDVVHVPTIKKTISISGEVRRPGIYELKNEKKLKQVLKLAGGLLPTALKNNIKLERVIGSEKKLIDINLAQKDSTSIEIESGDVLLIETVLDRKENVVYLEGEVLASGGYQWKPDMQLLDVIKSMRNLKPNADSEYVIIKRYLPPEYELSVLTSNLRKAFANPKGHSNIYLQPRDEVSVLSLNDKRILEVKPIVKRLSAQSRANEPSRVVRITGQVRGEGTYPLVEGMRITDLILAGGRLSESAFTLEAELTRFDTTAGKPREMSHIIIRLADALAGDSVANIVLQPYDLLNIKEIPLWEEVDQVELIGEVQFPGKYTVKRGETLHDLLLRAGGLTPFAYPQGAVFIREDLRVREQERMDAMAVNLEAELASINLERSGDSTQVQAGVANQLLTKLRATKAAGRLVIDLAGIARKKEPDDTDESIALRGGDKLYVPVKMQEVSVIGQVFHPTSHLFNDNLSAIEYVNLSGGATKKADKKSIYIVRANGSVQPVQEAWFDEKIEIFPGDTIVVPLDADRISKLKLWTSISQILYQLGLTAVAWTTVGLFR